MVLAEDPPADLSVGAVAVGRCCRRCGLTGSIVPAKGLGYGKTMVMSPPEGTVSANVSNPPGPVVAWVHAPRGIDICHETVRLWWTRFGPMFAAEIRRKRVERMRQHTHWRWRLDEV